MTCDIFKVMLKYGTLQLAVAMVMVGLALGILPLTVIGGALLGVDLFFLVSDRLNMRKHAR
jgi:hypothetical protein